MSEAKAEAVEICRAFRNKGKCRYGDECKYEHSEGEEIPNPPRGPCFNWQENGECNFGDRCRFKHGDDDDRFDADGNMKPREKKPKADADDGTPKKKSRRRRQRKPLTEEQINEKNQEVCNNYLAGKCRYGDECWRKHPEQAE